MCPFLLLFSSSEFSFSKAIIENDTSKPVDDKDNGYDYNGDFSDYNSDNDKWESKPDDSESMTGNRNDF